MTWMLPNDATRLSSRGWRDCGLATRAQLSDTQVATGGCLRISLASVAPGLAFQLGDALLNRGRWRTLVEQANAAVEDQESFHNRQRRHSALAMRSPIKFESTSTGYVQLRRAANHGQPSGDPRGLRWGLEHD